MQSLTRGLSILECLARAEGGLTLTDLAQRVQLPPSTAHRLLATLEKMGYVYQAGELGLWYVGLQAFTVGSSFLANRDFVAQSHRVHAPADGAVGRDGEPRRSSTAPRPCSSTRCNAAR